ncbi:response regulator [Candidatus Magnetaquicoccus inordinatus]|uniref:response regulator n=1 Tax=Candidatus Magnetaquicoccus inordinatus TaxID=2496818 RepID=UPI00102B1748|nr:response regulator [Candidatus Magnetaquicoccus inordinatus]
MDDSVQPIEILLIEDNPGDIALTKEALLESKINNRLHAVYDGEQALAFVRRQDPYQNAPRPDLILLDLNLPRRNGREVLQEIKQDPTLRAIPVVILTTSRDEEDILRSYALHANCYVSKPVDLEKFFQVIRSIEQFWFTVVKLPQIDKPGARIA